MSLAQYQTDMVKIIKTETVMSTYLTEISHRNFFEMKPIMKKLILLAGIIIGIVVAMIQYQIHF